MADAKLTALAALPAATDDDVLYIVDDPGGTPASKKITWANLMARLSTRSMGVTFVDSGGLTAGMQSDLYVPFACTITAVTLLADAAGSIVVDIWKDVLANYPPTVADTITAAAKPTLSTATNSQDTTLTGWTKAVAAGTTLRFNVDSTSGLTRCVLALTVAL